MWNRPWSHTREWRRGKKAKLQRIIRSCRLRRLWLGPHQWRVAAVTAQLQRQMPWARRSVRCFPNAERAVPAASNSAKAREATNRSSHWLETSWGIRTVKLAGIDKPSRYWIPCRSQVKSSPTKKRVWEEPHKIWEICKAFLKFPEEREPSQSTRKMMVLLILTTRLRPVSSTCRQSSAHTTQTGLLEHPHGMPSLIQTSPLDMKSSCQ